MITSGRCFGSKAASSGLVAEMSGACTDIRLEEGSAAMDMHWKNEEQQNAAGKS